MVNIRTATEKDVPRILELYRQLAHAPGSYRLASLADCHRILRKMHELPGYEILVAEENGEVVGTAVWAVLPGFAHGTSSFAVIEYMVVDDKVRRRGTGKKIMEYILTRAKESGCYKIMLTSDNRRQEAHEFYRSLGFEASAQGFRLYFT